MAQTSERIVRKDLGHAADVIERGDLVLHVLAKEAQAARVEAKVAELQVALAQARKGDAVPLRNWLDLNQAILTQFSYAGSDLAFSISEALPIPQRPPAVVDLQASTFQTEDLSELAIGNLDVLEPTSWDELAYHARKRIAAREGAERTSQIANPSTLDLLTNDLKDQPCTSTRLGWSHDRPASCDTSDRKEDDRTNATEAKTLEAPIVGSLGGDDQQCCLPSEFEEPIALDLPDVQLKRVKPTRFWFQNYKATSASVLTHFGLVVAMAFAGFKLPATVASLALQGSAPEAADTPLELTEVLDTSTDVEVAPSDEAAEPMVDTSMPTLSAGLPDASSLTSDNASSPLSAAGTGSTIAGAMAEASQGSGGRSGPNLKNMGASFFGASSSGNSFCYVIDASESMRGGAWESAKSELLRSIQSMKPNQRFYIIFFNQETQAIPMPGERDPAPHPLYATPENVRHAQNWVETLKLAKGAPPNDALELAISREPEAIYLLTDGVTKVDVPAFLRQANRTSDILFGEQVRVPVHAIAYHSQAGEQLMRRVASENKGQFIYVPKPNRK
jgi:von Willebrand factor type A domain